MPNLPISQLPLATSGQPESLMAIVNYDVDASGITNKIYFSALTEQFSGSSGTSGSSGSSGTSGSSGSSGTSGSSGSSGSSGTSGSSGSSGTSGSSGSSGTSGTSGVSGNLPFESSWVVTHGTNNYSFTVDQNSSYVMWVRGNIPNGILVWNATVTITNSNVPAIGVQYAWNYTGGGSPISLTSIPSQIIGTPGVINTVDQAASSSNTFVFGISNTTGENQTIYYGYAEI
jgi:hypothetical protein